MQTVSNIHVFPIRSVGGFSPQSWEYNKQGFLFDRNWSIQKVKPKRCLGMQEMPKMTLIHATISGDLTKLIVRVQDKEFCFETNSQDEDLGDEVAEAISTFLGTQVRLVKTPKDEVRPPYNGSFQQDILKQMEVERNEDYIVEPFLFTCKTSLEDLNQRLDANAEMIRFRPNVVINGTTKTFEEQNWTTVSIRENKFHSVGACIRCTMPNVNPTTGKKDLGIQAELIKFNCVNGNALFGMYMLPETVGTISVGDELTVQ
jgi:hypothetical protein